MKSSYGFTALNLLKSYRLSSFALIFSIVLSSFFIIGGCNDNGGGQNNSQTLTENDFAADSTLKANPEKGIVVTFLENPTSDVTGLDTGVIGIDIIPYKYAHTIEQTFCWEDDDVDATHFMELKDSEGNEVVRLDVNGECVTEIIEPGDYVMNIYLDGTIEDSRPIFIIPHPEDLEQSRKSNGLFNRFKFVVLNIIEEIQNNTIRNAGAQSVQENIDTLLSTNKCPGCDLRGADLEGADLDGANLSGADLSFANLINAYLPGADLTDAILNFSDLTDAILAGVDLSDANLVNADLSGTNIISSLLINVNLTGADVTGTDLRVCNLSGAVLTGADLNRTDFDGSDLTGADLSFANLNCAVLTGTDLSGTDFSFAIWCDTCRCADPSIGTCVGCPPRGLVCTGRLPSCKPLMQ